VAFSYLPGRPVRPAVVAGQLLPEQP